MRINPGANPPPTVADRSPREGDEQFEVITGRRPVFEWVMSIAADAEPRVDVRRGVGVEGLLTGPSAVAGVPHVTGVRTDAGDELTADLVIDSGGRRSAFASWLEAIGGQPFYEESEDIGFRYYGRYFQADEWPVPPRPTLGILGSVGLLALPADNTSWMVGVVATSKDKALYKLADEEPWTRVVSRVPAIAPYLDGKPISDVETMVAIPDRYRRFVVDGQPVVTGITAIADACAATNPMRGRGVSMGFMHAECLLEAMDHLDDPAQFAQVMDAATEREVGQVYRDTLALDRGMVAAFNDEAAGRPPAPSDPDDMMATIGAKVFAAAAVDADVWRGFVKIMNLLDQPPNVVMSEPVLSKLIEFELPESPPPPDLTARRSSRWSMVEIRLPSGE